MEKMIRIKAACEVFEISEERPEKKTVQRLEQIRKIFLAVQKRYGYSKTGTLSVRTEVVNPELF
jgi:hypothetical protein